CLVKPRAAPASFPLAHLGTDHPFLERRGDPGNEPLPDLVTVGLVEHFVASAGVETSGDVAEARLAVAVHKELDPREVLAHGILAARKEIDGQVAADSAEADWIGQSFRGGEKRRLRSALEQREAQWVRDEGIDDRRIAAQ